MFIKLTKVTLSPRGNKLHAPVIVGAALVGLIEADPDGSGSVVHTSVGPVTVAETMAEVEALLDGFTMNDYQARKRQQAENLGGAASPEASSDASGSSES